LLLLCTCAIALSGCPSPKASSDPKGSPALSPPAATAQTAAAERGVEHAELGRRAPDFTLTDLEGNTISLHDYAGKTIVLEWFNPNCPFVRVAHSGGSLEKMGAQQIAKGVVWLAINSNATGKEGSGVEANKKGRERFAIGYPILLDERGDVGHVYGATNTPHMFVIDKNGTLVYEGAIDDSRGGEPDPSQKVTNYVAIALDALDSGKQVATPHTKAWGCTVKYASK
jgi:peroxiredoxin